MKFSRQLSLGSVILGLVLGAINVVSLYTSGSYFPKLMVFATLLLCFGMVSFMFPGGDPGPDVPNNKKLAYSFSKASLVGKIMWILSAIAGIALGIWIDVEFIGGI